MTQNKKARSTKHQQLTDGHKAAAEVIVIIDSCDDPEKLATIGEALEALSALAFARATRVSEETTARQKAIVAMARGLERDT